MTKRMEDSMKRFRKLYLCLLICITILASVCLSSSAASVFSETNSSSQSDIEMMAENFASSELNWSSVTLSNIRALYNFNGDSIAYSVDVENNNTQQNGYVILSTKPNDEPIVQYSKDTTSPYDAISNGGDMCIYNIAGDYYAKSEKNSSFYDIGNKQILSDSDVDQFKQADANRDYNAPDISRAKNNRQELLTNKINSKCKPFTATILSGVPFYTQDSNSCVPTSAAMELKYLYPSYVPNDFNLETLPVLRNEMGWTAKGGVKYSNIALGIYNAMKYDWNYPGDINDYNTETSRSSATFNRVMGQIDNGKPFLITCTETSSNITYHQHCMCVVGYNASNSYLIVHDTWCTSNVTVNYNSTTAIGNSFFFTLWIV
jgi:hypothetical protein